MRTDHSTAAIIEADRFDYWHQWSCRNFSLTECQRQSAGHFSARASTWKFGEVELSDASSQDGGVVQFKRGAQEIRRDERDCYVFMLMARGSVAFTQDGREAQVGTGDMMLYHQARPFTMDFPGDGRTILLNIPRPLLVARLPEAHRITALRMCGESKFGTLAGTLLRQLVQLDEGADEAVLARLGSSAMDILVAALEAELFGPAERNGRGSAALHQVKRYILANLHDCELTLETIARAQNIAPRTLNRLFVADGHTPISWLWQQRLLASYKALAEGQVHQVTDAAMNYGFNDLSHFSRSFKKAFGRSPRSVRHMCGPRT
jgi:AraC-like DNA-binding protein